MVCATPWIALKKLRKARSWPTPEPEKPQRHWVTLPWRSKRLNLAEEGFIGLCRFVAENFRR